MKGESMTGISLRISEDATPREATEAALTCVRKHATERAGILKEETPFSVFATCEEKIIGGLIGKVFCNWLYADLVWVEEEFRGQDVGTRVMEAAEERAKGMKLTGIYLWTQTWQAPLFILRKAGIHAVRRVRGFSSGAQPVRLPQVFEVIRTLPFSGFRSRCGAARYRGSGNSRFLALRCRSRLGMTAGGRSDLRCMIPAHKFTPPGSGALLQRGSGAHL
jgi:GNAT superfamily N-acetyltransferase